MTNEIVIPQVLVTQRHYCLSIDQNNTKLYTYVQNLKKFVKDAHQIYQQLCKKMNNTSQEFQRKIANHKYTTKHRVSVLNFIKNMNVLNVSICNQLNKNGINLNFKNNKGPQNRLQILKKKLQMCNNLNHQFIQMVEIFNKKQKALSEKCEYFNDYQKSVIKYYSMKANTEYYEQLSAKELKVKERLQHLIRCKDQYKINISEIRVSLEDFYNTELNTISQFRKLLLNIRKKPNAQIYNQVIIEEQTEQSKSEAFQAPLTKRSQKIREQSIVEMRKQIVQEYESCFEIQQYFQEFMNQYKYQIELTARKIDVLRQDNQYQKITSERLIMAEIVSTQCLRQIDQIINQVSILREIISKLTNIFGVTRVLVELKKYRGFNFDKFIQDTNGFIEDERKNGISLELTVDYKRFQDRFHEKHNEFNSRYQERVQMLQKQIYEQYYFQGQILEEKSKRNMKNSLFEKKYYQILVIPFFLAKMDNYTYNQNKYLKKFSSHLNANKMQKMVTLTGFFGKTSNVRVKSTCCGLVRKEQKSEGPVLLDDFNCALKDGMILIQGKLKLYENYLRFYSTFNSRTLLFGSTDLRIPKWDIINFSKQSHLISLMVNVETSYGTLSFTSFLTNPLQKLLSIYNNRKSGSIAQNKNAEVNQLSILETRFQSEYRNTLKKNDILVDKLSTYLSQETESLSISIQYHMNKGEETVIFQIKISYSQFTMEYIFIHDDKQKNHKIRQTLEQVSKALINRKATEDKMNKNEKSVSFDFQESIIMPNQINKVSFLKEPSFIRRKENSFNEESFRASQVQLGQLLGSKNLLFNPQTSKNIEALEQKILLSEQNISKSTQQKPSPTSRLTIHQFESSTYHNTVSPSPKVQQKNTSNVTTKDRRRENTAKSRRSSQTASSSHEPFNYKTVFLLLGILLGLNLILGFFN